MLKKSLLFLICILSVHPGISQNESEHNSGFKRELIAFSIVSVSILYSGALIYNIHLKNADFTTFHFRNDCKAYLQADKLKHAFNAYAVTGTGYYLMTVAGMKKENAILTGCGMALLMLTPYEIVDGFSSLGGFSWSDMSANVAGTALFAGQELLFNEQVLKFKFSFSPSRYVSQAAGLLGNNFMQNIFLDNNGHTYWLSTSLNRFVLKAKLPSWLCISAGYSANGMLGEFENLSSYNGVQLPEIKRYRQFLVSLDIDWTEINTSSGFLQILFKGLNFIKIPFPALEFNSLSKIKGYWLYF